MKNLLLLVFVLAITSLCFEVMLRYTGFSPRVAKVNEYFIPNVDTTWSVPDDELGWVNRPGTSVAIGMDPAPMTFWDFGRRATRTDPRIPDGDQIPVMIVGGSVTQSYGVRDEDSFPYLLAQRYPELWIENLGTGGYGTVQSALLAQRAYDDFYPADRKPRLVLLSISGSHIVRNVSDQSWVLSITNAQSRYIAPPHYRIRGDTLSYNPFEVVGFWPLEFQSAGVALAHDVWLRWFKYNTASQGVAVTREVIRRFVDFAEQRKMQFGMIVTADDSQTTHQVLDDQAFPNVDCSGPDRADPKAYLLVGNGHPNPMLHEHFSQCIGRWLDEEVLPLLNEAKS